MSVALADTPGVRSAIDLLSAWIEAQVAHGDVPSVSIGIDPSQPDPTLTAGRLVPVADHTFRLESRNGFGSTGELVIFELGPDGSVQRLRVGDNYTYPIADW